MWPYFKLFLICLLVQTINAWDSEELEIFDVVEEVNRNFYEFMEISQNATTAEIKRAFRGLSIVLHPDKSSAEDANIQFRNLVSVYEILRDPGKREKYNKVLRDGLPNWKSALYYYRRMRKIGLYEGALIIFVITTIGQYLFAWAAYLEKKYTAEQIFGSKLKKLQKKNKSIDMETILNELPTPSIKNTLPFQIPMAIWYLPSTIKELFIKANELKEIALEKQRLEAEAAKEREELEKEMEEQARLKKEKKENLRKRKQNTKAPEKTDEDLQGYSQIQAREFSYNDQIRPVGQKTATTISGGFWTDDDLVELIRLVKKYPGGSSSRWETIAESMNRTVQEVTFMAAKMKEQGYRIPGQCATDSVAENIAQENQTATTITKKEKVKKLGDKNLIITETNWTQEQQRALEAAIVKYRKNASGDRWQKIANSVPGKTKEECLVRYKYLCDLVKTTQKKSQEEGGAAESGGGSKVEEIPNETAKSSESNDKVETIESLENPATAVEAESLDEATAVEEKAAGKKRNKRKERRRRRDFSSDEDSDDIYEYERT